MERQNASLSDDRALPNGRIWGRVNRPVILLTGQMSIMVAGKWAPVPPFFPSQGGGGGRQSGGEMAVPEQNNTSKLTFYINLLTRV